MSSSTTILPQFPSTRSQQRRKTRIVCISDTHNQTPKLPKGDVLIHAGDLTNQGSYTELKKTVTWLEKQDFEAVIVVAGNHDTTLDTSFFYSNKNKWKWPSPQDPVACRKLLTESKYITYLENETATIYLTSPTGPCTCLRVFGSPCSPGQRGWAFQYWGEEEAENVWGRVGMDVDVVVTHTPAYGFVDAAGSDAAGRAGCETLGRKLNEVRPLMSVCGHIHSGRGVERARWGSASVDGGSLEEPPPAYSPPNAFHSLIEAKEVWMDPGVGNNKISIVDLTAKSGHPIDNTGRLTRHVVPDSLRDLFWGQPDAVPGSEGPQPSRGSVISTSSLEDVALRDSEAVVWTRKAGGAVEWRSSDIGRSEVDAVAAQEKGKRDRHETAMINAAFLGPRNTGPMTFNKPIVVDVELPVWEFSSSHHVQ